MDVFNRVSIDPTVEVKLSAESEAILRNMLIDEMESYLEIVFNELAPIKHIQQQAYLNGRIHLLKQLLNKEI